MSHDNWLITLSVTFAWLLGGLVGVGVLLTFRRALLSALILPVLLIADLASRVAALCPPLRRFGFVRRRSYRPRHGSGLTPVAEDWLPAGAW